MEKSFLDILIFALVVVGFFAVITGMYTLITSVIAIGVIILGLKAFKRIKKRNK